MSLGTKIITRLRGGGAAITMLHPHFSVVIPEDISIHIPAVLPLRDDAELQRLLDSWIEIRKDDGTVAALYDYWILGRVLQEKHAPRWSVIRNVLGWVE